jgi:hypothetical protein
MWPTVADHAAGEFTFKDAASAPAMSVRRAACGDGEVVFFPVRSASYLSIFS